jgi:hypothetical protein
VKETFIKTESSEKDGVRTESHHYTDDFSELHLAIERTYESGKLTRAVYVAREYESLDAVKQRFIELEIGVTFARGEVVKFDVKDTHRGVGTESVVSHSFPVVNEKINRPVTLANKYYDYGKEQFFVIACDEISGSAAFLARRARNLSDTAETLNRIMSDAQYMKNPIRDNIVRRAKERLDFTSERRKR